jgi:hypothetical protein
MASRWYLQINALFYIDTSLAIDALRLRFIVDEFARNYDYTQCYLIS